MSNAQRDIPGAWRPRDFSSNDDFAFDLSDRHLAVLSEWAGRRREDEPLDALTRERFTHPDVDRDFGSIRDELTKGRGIVLIRGFPVDAFSEAEIEHMYWGVGSHLGIGVSQSARGDRMGYVQDETKPGEPESARGYLSRRGLGLHTDLAEIAGLLCVRPARTGGASLVASSMTVYQVIEREHPEFLPVLERGFPYHRRGEESASAEPVTPYNVPVFSRANGILSCFYVRGILDATFRATGRELSALERDALDCFDEVAMRDDVRLDIDLNAGEALILNNCATLHARPRFVDWDEPERKRLYFRLWLEGHERRPLVPEFFVYQNDSGYMGIDGQDGREPAQPEFLTKRPEHKMPNSAYQSTR